MVFLRKICHGQPLAEGQEFVVYAEPKWPFPGKRTPHELLQEHAWYPAYHRVLAGTIRRTGPGGELYWFPESFHVQRPRADRSRCAPVHGGPFRAIPNAKHWDVRHVCAGPRPAGATSIAQIAGNICAQHTHHEWATKADDRSYGTNGRKFKWLLLHTAIKPGPNDPQEARNRYGQLLEQFGPATAGGGLAVGGLAA